MWNRLEHRPLEGFIFALTPFNFTSICANLCAAPAMMGNVVIWKPAETQIYSAQVIMELFEAAGLPKGVINMVTVSGREISNVVFEDKNFSKKGVLNYQSILQNQNIFLKGSSL